MERFAYVLVIVLSMGILSAQVKVGTSGATFLKIGLIPRSMAMGEAYVAVANDAGSVFWNPAGLANLKTKGMFVSYTNWLVSTYVPAFSYVTKMGNFGNIAVFASAVQSPDFEEVTIDENGTITVTGKTFSYTALNAGLSYARYMTDKFAVGVNLKFVYEGFGGYASAKSVAIDAGTLFWTGFKSLRIAMSLQNLGPDLRPSGEYSLYLLSGSDLVTEARKRRAYKLPMVFRIGAAMEIIKSENQTLTIAIEGANPNDNEEVLSFGAEFKLNNMLSLRAGYAANKDEGGLGFGVGLKVQNIEIDYSFSDFGALTDIHRLGLNFSL
jgi:long-subunit fatty acid transport protein